jgi:hypothetical protein
MSLKLRKKFHRPDPSRVPHDGAWGLPAACDQGSTLGDSPGNRAASALAPAIGTPPRIARPIRDFVSDQWIGAASPGIPGADRRLKVAPQPNRQ